MAATEVSTNIRNERPAIEVDADGVVFIATRYLPGATGSYQIAVYRKESSESTFTPTVIHEE